MRTLFLSALMSFLLIAPAQAALRVLACEPEWAALTRELAGDLAEVDSATTALQDPHRIEARPSLLSDLSSGLKAIVSQRLLRRADDKGRTPAVEVMLNTKLVADMIVEGNIGGVKEAMEKSLAQGSQTFEADIARLIGEGLITRDEGVSFADSPTNLLWRLDNQAPASAKADAMPEPEPDIASFTEITLDVKPEEPKPADGSLANIDDLFVQAIVRPTLQARLVGAPVCEEPTPRRRPRGDRLCGAHQHRPAASPWASSGWSRGSTGLRRGRFANACARGTCPRPMTMA